MKELNMTEVATVALTKPSTGGVALRHADGSYALAEQLGAKQLQIGQKLVGCIESIGIERLTDQESGEDFAVFIQAYGLAFDAVQAELL
jgi:hypothetical protein